MAQSNYIYHYYLIGDRPIRLLCTELDIPVDAEILDARSKQFVRDLSIVPQIVEDTEYREIDYHTFCNACLAQGVTPL